jgi:undecaprenyl-diphosphatase
MPRPEQTFLFGIRYQIASELAFYTPGQPETVSINRWSRPNVYDYWWEDKDLLGFDAVGATAKPQNRQRLLEAFERVDEPVELKVYKTRGLFLDALFREPIRTFYLYRAYGFKGGLRWQPKDAKDVRAG